MKIRMTIELEDTIYQKVRACRTRYRCWASKCTKPTRTNLLFDCQYPIKQKPRCVCRGFFLLNMSQILTAQCAPRNLKNVYTNQKPALIVAHRDGLGFYAVAFSVICSSCWGWGSDVFSSSAFCICSSELY